MKTFNWASPNKSPTNKGLFSNHTTNKQTTRTLENNIPLLGKDSDLVPPGRLWQYPNKKVVSSELLLDTSRHLKNMKKKVTDFCWKKMTWLWPWMLCCWRDFHMHIGNHGSGKPTSIARFVYSLVEQYLHGNLGLCIKILDSRRVSLRREIKYCSFLWWNHLAST